VVLKMKYLEVFPTLSWLTMGLLYQEAVSMAIFEPDFFNTLGSYGNLRARVLPLIPQAPWGWPRLRLLHGKADPCCHLALDLSGNLLR